MGAFANALSTLPGDCLLVLDDLHVIDNTAIHEALQTLVAHQPPQLHLLIATREDPQLPLARLAPAANCWRCGPRICASRWRKPALSSARAWAWRLEPQEIAALDAQIEGWIAGLQLAALSLQNRAHRPS